MYNIFLVIKLNGRLVMQNDRLSVIQKIIDYFILTIREC